MLESTIEELRQRMRAMAALDAVLMPEWSFRYYSFNRRWSAGEELGSMRDGEGNHFFVHFTPAGVFVMGFDHEFRSEPKVFEGLPAEFDASRAEPAFESEYANLCTWRLQGGDWQHADVRQTEHLLEVLRGGPRAYQRWASEYYEVDVPLDAVEHVYGGGTIGPDLITALGGERTLDELADDLDQIGLGRSQSTSV